MEIRRSIQTLLVMVVLSLLILPQVGFSKSAAGPDPCNVPCIDVKSPGMAKFSEKYGTVKVRLCGYVKKLEIDNGKIQKGAPAEIADMVVKDGAKLLGYDHRKMLKTDEIKGPTGTRIKYCQTYKGIPIYSTCLIVKIDNSNKVSMVKCRTKDQIIASTTPVVDAQKAMDLCKTNLDIKDKLSLVKAPSLMVFSSGEKDRLVWRLLFTANDPSGSWETLIDAEDGDVVMSRNLFDY